MKINKTNKTNKTNENSTLIHVKEKAKIHNKSLPQAKLITKHSSIALRKSNLPASQLYVNAADQRKANRVLLYATGKIRQVRQSSSREVIQKKDILRAEHINTTKSSRERIKKKPDKIVAEKLHLKDAGKGSRSSPQEIPATESSASKGRMKIHGKETLAAATHMALSVGANTVRHDWEGGQVIDDSVRLLSVASSPITGAVHAGNKRCRNMAARKAAERRIKKVYVDDQYRRDKTANKTDCQIRNNSEGRARGGARQTAGRRNTQLARNPAKKAVKRTVKKAGKETARSAAKILTRSAGAAISAVTGTAGGRSDDPKGTAAGNPPGKKQVTQERKNAVRNRMIQLFVSGLRQEENKDSITKALKDIAVLHIQILIKKMITYIGLFLAGVFSLAALVALPVITVIAILYNSPFAIFFPSITSGDQTTQEVLTAYVADFEREIEKEYKQYGGYDRCEKVYVDYEGAGEPDNYIDILAVYMVRYGIGDTATDMTEQAKTNLRNVFDDMCTYSISSDIVSEVNEDGAEVRYRVKYVNISLLSYEDMIAVYHFGEEEMELLLEIMQPEYLAYIGYTGKAGELGQEVSDDQYQTILDAVSDTNGKKVIAYALSKVGYPYSQALRDSGTHFDCSSLVYYAWRKAGISLYYNGSNTAASEGQYCYENNYLVDDSEIQPGDLIFYSFAHNGRFMNISHVSIYVGNGMAVEAANERLGVVCRPVYSKSQIVFIGRPR